MAKRNQKKIPASLLNFTLHDGGEQENTPIEGCVESHGHAVDIYLAGYGVYDADDEHGFPICLDYFDGKLQVLVWSDINDQNPTHSIDLVNALITNRHISEEEVDEAWEAFIKEHIAPSRLFKLAMKLEEQTEEELEHFRSCAICKRFLIAYREAQ